MDEAFQPESGSERPSSHQRGEQRDSMFLMATMRVSETTEVSVRVRNISAGGLMGECSTPLSQGDPVEVELRNIGTVSGRIAWTTGQRLGVAFDTIIDPLLARKPVGAQPRERMLVKPPVLPARRPGLRIE
ncbi:MAG: hypothetical protein JWN59_1148 [Sphingomonas bacterium]|nr:hypothetical protein [Sphingomonas bacterium]